MNIKLSTPAEIKELTDISKRAFDTDISVGASDIGGPPYYDSEDWHVKLMSNNNLYTITHNNHIIGGVILFPDEQNKKAMYIGRIFIDPVWHKKGFGLSAMKFLEAMFPDITLWRLETPVWNTRTNSFYKKLGYCEMHKDIDSVYYQKEISAE